MLLDGSEPLKKSETIETIGKLVLKVGISLVVKKSIPDIPKVLLYMNVNMFCIVDSFVEKENVVVLCLIFYLAFKIIVNLGGGRGEGEGGTALRKKSCKMRYKLQIF